MKLIKSGFQENNSDNIYMKNQLQTIVTRSGSWKHHIANHLIYMLASIHKVH